MPSLVRHLAALGGTLASLSCSPTESTVDAQNPQTMTGASGFFALSVADLAGSERWYAEKFGMTTLMRIPKQNGIEVAVLGSGNFLVELVANDAARNLAPGDAAANDRVLLRGPFKVGLIVDAFDAAVAALRSRGAEIAFGPFPASGSQKANVIVKDNSGNLIQVIGR